MAFRKESISEEKKKEFKATVETIEDKKRAEEVQRAFESTLKEKELSLAKAVQQIAILQHDKDRMQERHDAELKKLVILYEKKLKLEVLVNQKRSLNSSLASIEELNMSKSRLEEVDMQLRSLHLLSQKQHLTTKVKALQDRKTLQKLQSETNELMTLLQKQKPTLQQKTNTVFMLLMLLSSIIFGFIVERALRLAL
jgi:hypothetical protein